MLRAARRAAVSAGGWRTAVRRVRLSDVAWEEDAEVFAPTGRSAGPRATRELDRASSMPGANEAQQEGWTAAGAVRCMELAAGLGEKDAAAEKNGLSEKSWRMVRWLLQGGAMEAGAGGSAGGEVRSLVGERDVALQVRLTLALLHLTMKEPLMRLLLVECRTVEAADAQFRSLASQRGAESVPLVSAAFAREGFVLADALRAWVEERELASAEPQRMPEWLTLPQIGLFVAVMSRFSATHDALLRALHLFLTHTGRAELTQQGVALGRWGLALRGLSRSGLHLGPLLDLFRTRAFNYVRYLLRPEGVERSGALRTCVLASRESSVVLHLMLRDGRETEVPLLSKQLRIMAESSALLGRVLQRGADGRLPADDLFRVSPGRFQSYGQKSTRRGNLPLLHAVGFSPLTYAARDVVAASLPCIYGLETHGLGLGLVEAPLLHGGLRESVRVLEDTMFLLLQQHVRCAVDASLRVDVFKDAVVRWQGREDVVDQSVSAMIVHIATNVARVLHTAERTGALLGGPLEGVVSPDAAHVAAVVTHCAEVVRRARRDEGAGASSSENASWRALKAAKLDHEAALGRTMLDSPLPLATDVSFPARNVVLEVDGPHHFSPRRGASTRTGPPGRLLPHTTWQSRLVAAAGHHLVRVGYDASVRVMDAHSTDFKLVQQGLLWTSGLPAPHEDAFFDTVRDVVAPYIRQHYPLPPGAEPHAPRA
jgi:hypothetical protein